MKVSDQIPCLKVNDFFFKRHCHILSINEISLSDINKRNCYQVEFFCLNFYVHFSRQLFCTSFCGPAGACVPCFRNSLGTEDCCASDIPSFLLFNRLKEYPWFGSWFSSQLYIKVWSAFVSKYYFLKSNAFPLFGNYRGRNSTKEVQTVVKPMNWKGGQALSLWLWI